MSNVTLGLKGFAVQQLRENLKFVAVANSKPNPKHDGAKQTGEVLARVYSLSNPSITLLRNLFIVYIYPGLHTHILSLSAFFF